MGYIIKCSNLSGVNIKNVRQAFFQLTFFIMCSHVYVAYLVTNVQWLRLFNTGENDTCRRQETSLHVPAHRPLMYATLAGQLGWRCLLSVRNTLNYKVWRVNWLNMAF